MAASYFLKPMEPMKPRIKSEMASADALNASSMPIPETGQYTQVRGKRKHKIEPLAKTDLMKTSTGIIGVGGVRNARTSDEEEEDEETDSQETQELPAADAQLERARIRPAMTRHRIQTEISNMNNTTPAPLSAYRDPSYLAVSSVSEVPGNVNESAKTQPDRVFLYLSIVRPDTQSGETPYDANARNAQRLRLGNFYARDTLSNTVDIYSQPQAMLFTANGLLFTPTQYAADLQARLMAQDDFAANQTAVVYCIPLNKERKSLISYIQARIEEYAVYLIDPLDPMSQLLDTISGMYVSGQRARGDITHNFYVAMDGLLFKVRTHGQISTRCHSAFSQVEVMLQRRVPDMDVFAAALQDSRLTRTMLAQCIHCCLIRNTTTSSNTTPSDKRTMDECKVILGTSIDNLVDHFCMKK